MSYPKLEQRLAFGIHQLSAQMARICNPIFRRYHVDQISAQILVLTAERGTIAPSEIVSALKLPQSTVSHQIKRLQHHKYVVRRRDASDQRIIRLELSATGRLVATACDAVSQDVYRAMVAGLDETTIGLMRQGFATMLSSLASVQAGGIDDESAPAAAARAAG